MRQSPLNVVSVFAATFALGGGATLAYLRLQGLNPDTLGLALRVSAWSGLLVFLVIFVSRPLTQLADATFAKRLVSNRRLLGVAFAAIMSVHLVLLLYVNGWVPNLPGRGAYLFILLMLLTSFDRAVALLGPRWWRRLHKTGLYWIGGIFAFTIASALVAQPGSPVHLVLASLFAAALVIRRAAYVKVRRRSILPGSRRLPE